MVNMLPSTAPRAVTPALDHQGILAEVRRRGSSLRKLSIEAGFAPSTVNASLYKRHPRAHAVLAAAVGCSRHELWPHWYGPDDAPLPLPGAPLAGAVRS